ncbi:hypothetical protein [Ktedonospora formicarum]|uniref:Uncharacterized protein n=1 Tax=Ktedonospora formicarum TaxID=2778364 RepID=A0A8J3MT17_9CHLR|nr:hypothetical protein [Ktedonospora formicarum]GHO45178.1 hypothetical protein KSX_33410 [Ktedonospora formicarum]
MKQLLLAYLDAGESWPEEVNTELRKYYRRTYLNPRGSKHTLYLAWRQEWEESHGITYLPNKRVN